MNDIVMMLLNDLVTGVFTSLFILLLAKLGHFPSLAILITNRKDFDRVKDMNAD